jgi:glycosyltransferase 2 family protein
MNVWFKKNRQSVLRWGGTLLSFVLLAVLVSIYWKEVAAALQRVTLGNLLLAFVFVLTSRLSTVARWHTLLRSGGVPISARDTASLTFTGLFASNFLPTTIGGDVVRLAGAMQMGYDRAICLASIAADRLVNMTGMSMAAPFGIFQLLQAGPLPAFALSGLWQKGWDFLRRTLGSLTIWLKKPLALLQALAFAWLNLLCVVAAYYFLIRGLGGYLPYWKLIGLISLAYFITLVPVSINGYGLHELSITFLFSQIGGVSIPVSAVVVVLQRLLMVSASTPGAFFLPGVMAKMDKSQAKEA